MTVNSTPKKSSESTTLSKPSKWLMVLSALGIVLVALNLRACVAALSPIYEYIDKSFHVSPQAQGIIGMLPTLSFAIMGLVTPRLSKYSGLVWALSIGMILVIVGNLGRAYLSNSALVLGLFSILAFFGMGIGNILLPSAIKHYFPNNVGSLTAIYNVLVAIGAAAPSFLGVILTHAFGWRFSVGIWGMLAIIALLPWLGLLKSEHHQQVKVHHPHNFKTWKWSVAWGVTGVFAGGAAAMYAFIAWLPSILVQTAGISTTTAGVMLAIYNLVGLVHNAIVPKLIVSMRHNVFVILFAALCIIVGALGLAFAPQWAWFWIFPAGLGAMNITIGLTLINIRSRTEDGTTALSGFMQGVGYLIGSIGPLTVGELYSLSGGWVTPLCFIAAIGVFIGLCGFVACRKEVIEDSAAN